MPELRAFRALRPQPEYADQIVSVPYDVVDREEARAMAKGAPWRFLRITRSDLEFPDSVDAYSDQVYARAVENLEKFQQAGKLLRETSDHVYIYRLNQGSRQQTGLVALSSIEDYRSDRIKKHELTRAEKERDRTVHIDRTGANTGPVFLLYNNSQAPRLAQLMDAHADTTQPLYDVSFDDGVRHRIWPVGPGAEQSELLALYHSLPAAYIADGHHRAASAVSVGGARRKSAAQVSGKELFNYFLTVSFPDDQLSILPYNRAVVDLNGHSGERLLQLAAERFEVLPATAAPPAANECRMLLEGQWRTLRARAGSYDDNDPIASLMVSILQANLLGPVLGIEDPRTSDRISFIGGIRGEAELERLLASGKFQLAFSMPPVSTAQLIAVSDAGKIMPPKSTWFEPKLRSGFLVHLIDA
ncbi:MAG: DUF1015 family protein [Leptospirales bacterium]|nr:DUF1015 family protein [Leptospirales bacterium]